MSTNNNNNNNTNNRRDQSSVQTNNKNSKFSKKEPRLDKPLLPTRGSLTRFRGQNRFLTNRRRINIRNNRGIRRRQKIKPRYNQPATNIIKRQFNQKIENELEKSKKNKTIKGIMENKNLKREQAKELSKQIINHKNMNKEVDSDEETEKMWKAIKSNVVFGK